MHGTRMNRREFLVSTAALTAVSTLPALSRSSGQTQGFPDSVLKNDPYIENPPIAEYHSAPASAYESFQDMRFGIRIHWGIYSIWHRGAESWPASQQRLMPDIDGIVIGDAPNLRKPRRQK